jgi:FHA domain
MNDPRLNSVHLEFPRRQEFRLAREALLEARGLRTLVEGQYEPAKANAAARLQERRDDPAPDSEYWLMDHAGIYPLRVGVNTIGRLPDNDVVIPGAYVSRRHCAILVHAGDGCELHDVASKNGTYINGLRLCGPTQLAAGDEIRMCDRQFIFMSNHGPGNQPNRGRTEIGE